MKQIKSKIEVETFGRMDFLTLKKKVPMVFWMVYWNDNNIFS